MTIRIIEAAAILLTANAAFAADQTWTGTLSDKMCGADHKEMRGKMTDRDCTLACTKGGTAFALISGNKIYTLSGREADLRTHAGHVVKLTGDLKGETIRVSAVDMPKQ